MKVLFVPVSIGGSLAAGALGRWLFSHLWQAFDDQEPPQAAHRRTSWTKVLLSAALRGAVFAGVRAAVDAARVPRS